MKPLYILKIGGSVATNKDRSGFSVRGSLLKKIGKSIKSAQKNRKFDLILIHGAGSAGHQLAREYDLKEGTGKNPKKIRGAILSRIANQRLNLSIFEILHSAGLFVAPVHTASAIVQKNRKISSFDLKTIKEALKGEYIPLLYGEMVFDEKLGMSICSGDAIAPYLAKKMGAKNIFFASDTDGIFDKDPHFFKNAKLLQEISLKGIEKISLSDSHNIDATGGMRGKLMQASEAIRGKNIKIEIFNGLRAENYKKILLGKNFPHTVLTK
jgi:isopentenyl phosphate kinase